MSQTISTTLTLFRADTEWEVTVSGTVYSPEPGVGIFEPQIEDITMEEATTKGKVIKVDNALPLHNPNAFALSDHEYSLAYEALLETAQEG